MGCVRVIRVILCCTWYYLLMYFSVLSVLAFICNVYLSYDVVILAVWGRFFLPLIRLNPPFFFLKWPIPSQQYSSCYQIVCCNVYLRFMFCHSSVFLLFHCSLLSWRIFLGFGSSAGYFYVWSNDENWIVVCYCCLFSTWNCT